MEHDPDDGHEHDFGLSDGFGKPLTDTARCLLCGLSIMAGYEFPIDWSQYEVSAPSKPLRSTQPKKGTP